jgi:hypothetical protein
VKILLSRRFLRRDRLKIVAQQEDVIRITKVAAPKKIFLLLVIIIHF